MTEKTKEILPAEFIEQMKYFFCDEELDLFLEAIKKEPKSSVRINPFKRPPISENHHPVKWSQEGFFLNERPTFTLDPNFHSGAYYVQEASSMFLDHILTVIRPPKNGVFLDLCAAPGGKSMILSSYLGSEGILLANEAIKSRVVALKENTIKWGLGNTVVSNNDSSQFSNLGGFFDLVLVDAPCSGEGMFRKDPAAINEWSREHVEICASRQARILGNAAALVKAGGFLIYCTCTYNLRENEEMVRYLVANFDYEPVEIPVPEEWKVATSNTRIGDSHYLGYRFYPHLVKGEGLFITVLRRPKEVGEERGPEKKTNFRHPFIQKASKAEIVNIDNLFFFHMPGAYYKLNDSFFWCNPTTVSHFERIVTCMNIRYFGVELGKFAKGNFLPNHEFALSLLDKSGYPVYEVNLPQASAYLKKEEVGLEDCPEGWVLLHFQHLPIGWIKNLGNRINNYYPKDWRIRMR